MAIFSRLTPGKILSRLSWSVSYCLFAGVVGYSIVVWGLDPRLPGRGVSCGTSNDSLVECHAALFVTCAMISALIASQVAQFFGKSTHGMVAALLTATLFPGLIVAVWAAPAPIGQSFGIEEMVGVYLSFFVFASIASALATAIFSCAAYPFAKLFGALVRRWESS